MKAFSSKLDKMKYMANYAQYLINSNLPNSFTGREINEQSSEEKILSRQKRQFSVFSLLNFLLVVFNVVLDINNNIRKGSFDSPFLCYFLQSPTLFLCNVTENTNNNFDFPVTTTTTIIIITTTTTVSII